MGRYSSRALRRLVSIQLVQKRKCKEVRNSRTCEIGVHRSTLARNPCKHCVSNRDAPVAQLDRAPPSEGGGHTFESCRARHSTTAKASPACAASSGILAAVPRRCGSQPKISKTTPCKVAGARREGRFEPILDASGKSAALLHHRTIRQMSPSAVSK